MAAGDATRYSARGQLVDLGGNRMHIHCVGQGSPTGVLNAGLGGFHSIGTSSNRNWLPQLASAPTTVPATAGATRVLNLGHRGRLPRNCTLCCLLLASKARMCLSGTRRRENMSAFTPICTRKRWSQPTFT
jgi:hypothetical protein